jgi:SAM-dependent methyltransferase
MEAEYARAYANLYRNHWWWRAREDYLVDVLRERLPTGGGALILDVGCGSGLFFQRLRPLGEVRGVETDETMRTGDPAIDGRIHWGPLDSLPPDERFTCILMLDVLEHMSDPAGALRQARTRLASGGFLVATVPAFPVLWTRHDDANQHVRRYTRGTFRPLLREAGFTPLQLRYFFHWTFPAKLLVRLAETLRRGPEPSVVPPIPALPINRGLYWLSRQEQRVFRRTPLPVGSSLLALAVPAELASGVQTS